GLGDETVTLAGEARLGGVALGRTLLAHGVGVGLLDLDLGESGRPDRLGPLLLHVHVGEPDGGLLGLGALGATLCGHGVLLGGLGVGASEDGEALGLGAGGLLAGVGLFHGADELGLRLTLGF